MRVKLVFPPSICLPNQIYYSLPVLAAMLRRAGHEPSCVDLNLAAADRLLEPTTLTELLRIGHALERTARATGRPQHADNIRRHIDNHEATFHRAVAGKAVLRDPVAFYDRDRFYESFWAIVEALAGFYTLDPVMSPFRPDFVAALLDNQRRDPWTGMTWLYENGLLDEVLDTDPELIGICVAFPEQAVESVRLMRRLKQRAPHVPIVVGGPLITGFERQWLEGGWLLAHCDFVCVGDGERTIVELCEALEGRRGLDGIENLVWNSEDGRLHQPTGRVHANLDEVPVPDFASCDMQRAFLPEPIYPIMLSRGCYWGKCTFCSIGWRQNYRMAGRDRIAEEVRNIAAYGGRLLQVQDSSIPPAAARRLATVLRDECLPMHWCSNMKFERCHLDADYCRHLGGAGGCRSLAMGLEAADQRVLDLMQKGYRFDDLPQILGNLRAAEISVELLWFLGFPTQTRQEALHTARWLVDHCDMFGMTLFTGNFLLHPDTEVHDRPADFGVRIHEYVDDHAVYSAASGMQPHESKLLKHLLACNDNRTLAANGSHLPHLARRRLDVERVARPSRLPADAAAFCGIAPTSSPARAGRDRHVVSGGNPEAAFA